jgi:hypothetical protein
VTILATNATVPGKTIQLQDIQIVNGLQTTETIFRHFQAGSVVSRDRALLVKIIVSLDAQARDRIIRATNNQSPVEIASLHATDKIQRDIEAILERHSWYYERRKNYYRNIGKSPSRFVTPIYLASAVLALIFKNPSPASSLRSKFMRSQEGYDSVFSPKLPIEVWPVLAHVYKQVDAGLTSLPSPERRGERFKSVWRPLVALIVVARQLKTFGYAPRELVEKVAAGEITKKDVREVWEIITQANVSYDWKTKFKQSFALTCCDVAANKYGLAGLEAVGHRDIKTAPSKWSSSEVLKQVEILLPEQPWKRGTHVEIAEKIGCKAGEVRAAIQQLIADGKRNVQRDGVVYDSGGAVLAIDSERARAQADPNRTSDKRRTSK